MLTKGVNLGIPLAREPVAQIAPHNAGSDTHISAYVQLLGI